MECETIESLRRILDYLHDDEKRHWEEDGKPKDDHIYLDIIEVTKWLDSGGD
jgi:hypothetical protein